jgi:hypothetical protein
MCYTEFEHRHNFASWAAARAAQRGVKGFSVNLAKEALEQCCVMSFVMLPPSDGEEENFDKLHKKWCGSICDYFKHKRVVGVTYGRAAKLVAVYLKNMAVLPDLQSTRAKYIHPPIDSILLSKIPQEIKVKLADDDKARLRNARWTQLGKAEYFKLLKVLKKINGDEPLWQLEKYWTVTNT